MGTQKKASVQLNRLWFNVALILSLLVLAVSLFQPNKKAGSPASTASATSQVQALHLGWDVVDYLLSRRERYRKVLGEEGLPEWRFFTDDYFRDLKARRDAVITWARSQPSKPVIVFMGQIHPSLSGIETQEQRQRIDDMQARLFENIRREVQDAQVIAVEDSGCQGDETVTPQVMVRILRESAQGLYRASLNEAQASQMMRDLPAAGVRAILELKTPVICGEERWLHWMQTRLIQRAPFPDPKQRAVQQDLIGAFTHLRSEISLIRTLEALRNRQGKKGIIIQGDDHRRDAEKLVPAVYPVALITRPASDLE